MQPGTLAYFYNRTAFIFHVFGVVWAITVVWSIFLIFSFTISRTFLAEIWTSVLLWAFRIASPPDMPHSSNLYILKVDKTKYSADLHRWMASWCARMRVWSQAIIVLFETAFLGRSTLQRLASRRFVARFLSEGYLENFWGQGSQTAENTFDVFIQLALCNTRKK